MNEQERDFFREVNKKIEQIEIQSATAAESAPASPQSHAVDVGSPNSGTPEQASFIDQALNDAIDGTKEDISKMRTPDESVRRSLAQRLWGAARRSLARTKVGELVSLNRESAELAAREAARIEEAKRAKRIVVDATVVSAASAAANLATEKEALVQPLVYTVNTVSSATGIKKKFMRNKDVFKTVQVGPQKDPSHVGLAVNAVLYPGFLFALTLLSWYVVVRGLRTVGRLVKNLFT